MVDAETIARTVRDGYDARRRGDKEALAGFFAAGATFRMVGHAALGDRLPVEPADAVAAIGALIDQFTFNRVDVVHLLTDSRTAMLQLRLEVATGGDPIHTEACDIWEFDENGKVTSITQFVDTLLVVQAMEELVG